ncbi:MAG: polyprenyl synthetase family protein [Bacteroidales bacterium]|nr:polyprenyl synthetase family protein [Bacteroidales bacterium]
MEYTLEYLGTEADRYLAELSYPTTAPGLFEPVKYTFETGGKRVRPAVCMATYAALSGRDPHEIINQACAIEMFHNFTLLHDDVMDRAEVRRGRPTVHVKWDTASAILSGDAMLTLAYDMIADGSGEHFAKIFRLFSKTAMEIYEGQQLDMEFESRSDVSVEEYMEMITLKTSVLIGCACRMGAELAGADADTCRRFYDYGMLYGLSFQMRDDWLDTFGDPAVFGKEIGGDILCDKKTWLRIMAEKEAPAETAAAAAISNPEEKVEAMRSLYRSLGLDRLCDETARSFSNQAKEAIASVSMPEAAREFFDNLALKACTRQK